MLGSAQRDRVNRRRTERDDVVPGQPDRSGPRGVADSRRGARPATVDDPTHRLGELHLAGRLAGNGVGAHEQVLRGVPGTALLRRQRLRRRDRGSRPRPRDHTFRRRVRERPTARGIAREPRGVSRARRARRDDPRDAARPGWTPHARVARFDHRKDVSLRLLRRHRRGRGRFRRADRLRRGPRPRTARAPPLDRRGHHRVHPDHRSRAVP